MPEGEIAEKLHSVFTQPRFDTGVKFDAGNKTATEIEKRIRERDGKIPFSEFMDISLYSEHGYYSSGKVDIGIEKDFQTSPEASELFGASITSVLIKTWSAMGRPERFQVVEMGAGQGALAHSILQWAEDLDPDFSKSLQYTIVEYAKDLIPRQQEKLAMFQNVQWIRGSAYELPLANIEGAFISNELPDAFPVERVAKLNGEVKQKFVSIDDNSWVEIWDNPSPEVAKFIEDNKLQIHGGVEEPINIKALELQRQLDQALNKGVILTVDYGKNGTVGVKNTIGVRTFGRSGNMYRRDFLKAYEYPGNVDITSSINFSILTEQSIKDGLKVVFSGTQYDFLTKAGIAEIATKMREIAQTTRFWDELVRMSKNISGYHFLSSSTANFYSLMVAKGINTAHLDFINTQEAIDTKPPKVPVRLPESGKTYYLGFPSLAEEAEYDTNIMITDEEGRLWLYPHTLERIKIIGTDQKVVLDLTQKENLVQVVKDAGYIMS